MRLDALDEARTDVGEFFFAHPADLAQRFHSSRPNARQIAQRSVVKDYVGWHPTLRGDFTTQLAQTLEQRLVNVAPRSFFNPSPLRFLCLQQSYRARSAHHFPRRWVQLQRRAIARRAFQ